MLSCDKCAGHRMAYSASRGWHQSCPCVSNSMQTCTVLTTSQTHMRLLLCIFRYGDVCMPCLPIQEHWSTSPTTCSGIVDICKHSPYPLLGGAPAIARTLVSISCSHCSDAPLATHGDMWLYCSAHSFTELDICKLHVQLVAIAEGAPTSSSSRNSSSLAYATVIPAAGPNHSCVVRSTAAGGSSDRNNSSSTQHAYTS